MLQRFCLAASVLALAAIATFAEPARPAENRPNIIFIMADDLGYGDLGCYGQQKIKTPRLDALAAQGIRFTQFYAGSTVCAPSRSCLMTGQHTGHTRIRGNFSNQGGRVPLRPEDVTVAEVLSKAGYATGIIGKWGLGEPNTTGIPNRQGFDYWFGYLNQAHAHEYYPDYLWRNQERVELTGNQGGRREQYSHDLFTQEALRFVERNSARPFFLYLPYTIPHLKAQIPDLGPYADVNWPEPDRTRAAMITRMDRDIGALLDLLDRLKIAENTIVFFASDNGATSAGDVDLKFTVSNGPLRGEKRDLYEGGIRVPMIVRWPGKTPAGKVSEQVWAMWDVLPTLAEIVGMSPPEGIDGLSMRDALLGKRPARDHDYLYWEFYEGGCKQAVRLGDWKAVRLNGGQPLELYNLAGDLGETKDLAAQHPDLIARMEGIMREAHTPSPNWVMKGEAVESRPAAR